MPSLVLYSVLGRHAGGVGAEGWNYPLSADDVAYGWASTLGDVSFVGTLSSQGYNGIGRFNADVLFGQDIVVTSVRIRFLFYLASGFGLPLSTSPVWRFYLARQYSPQEWGGLLSHVHDFRDFPQSPFERYHLVTDVSGGIPQNPGFGQSVELDLPTEWIKLDGNIFDLRYLQFEIADVTPYDGSGESRLWYFNAGVFVPTNGVRLTITYEEAVVANECLGEASYEAQGLASASHEAEGLASASHEAEGLASASHEIESLVSASYEIETLAEASMGCEET